MGSLLAKAKHVSDSMVYEAARGLSISLLPEEIEAGNLYPNLARIREVSAQVAAAVVRQALEENLVREPKVLDLAASADKSSDTYDAALLDFVKARMWDPNQPNFFAFP